MHYTQVCHVPRIFNIQNTDDKVTYPECIIGPDSGAEESFVPAYYRFFQLFAVQCHELYELFSWNGNQSPACVRALSMQGTR